jgi:GntR family transcriptional repressor for pyruvate dehydrogenase complex
MMELEGPARGRFGGPTFVGAGAVSICHLMGDIVAVHGDWDESKSVEITRSKRERVYQQVVEHIHTLVREGVLSPGDQLLPERQLADKLGVSRAALREGLSVLVSQGLIEVTRGGGAVIRESSIENLVDPLAAIMLKEHESVQDLLEARIILEVGAVRLAAERAELSDLYRIQEAALEMNECMRTGQPPDEADIAFHMGIVQASHNPVLISVMTMISALISEVYGPSRRRLIADPEKLEYYAQKHIDILEAIQNRDPRKAVRLTTQYFETVIEGMRGLQAIKRE